MSAVFVRIGGGTTRELLQQYPATCPACGPGAYFFRWRVQEYVHISIVPLPAGSSMYRQCQRCWGRLSDTAGPDGSPWYTPYLASPGVEWGTLIAIFSGMFGIFLLFLSLWLLPVSLGLFWVAYIAYRRKLFQNPDTTPRLVPASQLPWAAAAGFVARNPGGYQGGYQSVSSPQGVFCPVCRVPASIDEKRGFQSCPTCARPL